MKKFNNGWTKWILIIISIVTIGTSVILWLGNISNSAQANTKKIEDEIVPDVERNKQELQNSRLIQQTLIDNQQRMDKNQQEFREAIQDNQKDVVRIQTDIGYIIKGVDEIKDELKNNRPRIPEND